MYVANSECVGIFPLIALFVTIEVTLRQMCNARFIGF